MCMMPKEASVHIFKGGLYCALTQVSTFYLRLVTSITLGCVLVLLKLLELNREYFSGLYLAFLPCILKMLRKYKQ